MPTGRLGPGPPESAIAPGQGKGALDREPAVLAYSWDEQGHDFVADHLVDHRVVLEQDVRRQVVEAVHGLGEGLGSKAFRECGGVTDVGKEDADVDLGAPWRQSIVAEVAEIRILARGTVTDEPQDLSAEAGERFPAADAAPRAGQKGVAATVATGEHTAPEFFVIRANVEFAGQVGAPTGVYGRQSGQAASKASPKWCYDGSVWTREDMARRI